MTGPDSELRRQLEDELKRLGLSQDAMPFLMFGPRSIAEFTAHLKRLEPGVTWHDVLPGLPRHWETGKPETWITPYRPLGPYDYQELPTAPAIHIMWSEGGAERLGLFLASARAARWPVFGAGLVAMPANGGGKYHAMIVMERGTNEDTLHAFWSWIDDQPDVEVAAVPRLGTEPYSSTGEAAV